MIRVGRTYINAPFVRSNRLRDTLEIECWHHVDLHMDDSHAVARALNNDLHGQIGDLIAVHSDGPARLDGFYVLRQAEIETINQAGRFSCFLTLDYVGSSSDVLFESRLIGTVKENDFDLVEADAEPIHAPPPHTNYDPRHTTTVDRGVAYEDDLTVYRDVPFTVDPKWGVEASDFYIGAATVQRREPLYPELGPIGGTQLFIEQPEDIKLTNGIVRFWMQDSGVATVAFWDGTAWRDKPLRFVAEGSAIVQIDHVTILRNSPNRSTVRYYGTPPSGNGRVSLDVTVQRGGLGMSCLLRSDASGTLGVFDANLTDMTVTSNRMAYSSADSNGHKLLFVTMHNYSNTAVDGYMFKNGTTRFDVFVGMELSGAGSGNQAADLAAEYAAALSEDVRAVKR